MKRACCREDVSAVVCQAPGIRHEENILIEYAKLTRSFFWFN